MITIDICKTANEELQKIISLCQMSGRRDFQEIYQGFRGNIEPVSIGNNLKSASIITKSLVNNILPINKRPIVSYDSFFFCVSETIDLM